MRQRTWLFTVLAGLSLWLGVAAADDYRGPGTDNGGGAPLGPSPTPLIPGSAQNFPGPPSQPTSPSRPPSWPGGGTAQPPGYVRSRLGDQTGQPLGEQVPIEGGQWLARDGSDNVLSGDLFGGIYDLFDRAVDKKLPPERQEQVRRQLVQAIREAVDDLAAHTNDPNPLAGVASDHQTLLRNLLRGHLETLEVCNDARNLIPAESLDHIQESMAKDFEELQLKKLMKQADVQSRDELDRKLRSYGSSLDREKEWFMRRDMAGQWMGQQLKSDEEITHQELLEWYQAHLHTFDKPARARWEELMVRTDKYPNRAAAYAAIAQMGNQVVVAGRPLAEVACAQSDGATAAEGGLRDWTTKGSLVAEELDRALFTQPVGQPSPTILETANGLHIIRVLERQEATRTSFPEAQEQIRKQIKQERSAKKAQEYMAKMQRLYPPWTIFDAYAAPRLETARHDEPPGSEPDRRE